ncbi:uncharacterized protein TRIVIDRAFT_229271 [Trichoderma virens Gv29-8]|uniref:Uncharacterized protein n=1 Tax=Hypocrea virens (strain Gv29-8 / FGSC 10586) TaxID=413071 RepID=G9MHK1_HYPVG|nr:uncharacterized protein TRIVIDRAFT_229271 [Trichoderma virens Gv29-8]EHK26189.1 hypothetical protein TRIVIDRAFT_229271 [Trichoderma virens Gv29-8]
MQARGAEDQCLHTQYQLSLQMPHETLALHLLGEELGLLLLIDGDTAPSQRVIAATAGARRLRDESGVQYRAIANHLCVRIPSKEIEIDRDSPLMTEEMMFRPLDSASVTKRQDGATAGDEAGQVHDRDHRSEMTDHIEGEMITAPSVTGVAAGVVKGKGEHRLERRPESEV